MRIESLRSEKTAPKARISATVIWEDCDRPTRGSSMKPMKPSPRT